MRAFLILTLTACPAAAWQTTIDASKPGPGIASPTTTTLAASGSRATTGSDDFNRASGTDMGSDWTEILGDMGITSNTGYGMSSQHNLMLHNSVNGDYAESVQSIDFLPRVSGPDKTYVALICAHHLVSLNNLHIRVQDTTLDGLYNRVFFMSGVSPTFWDTSCYFDLAVPTPSGRMRVTFENGGDMAVLDIDRNFDGIWDEQFSCGGILSAGLSLGDTYGIGSFRQGAFDNWLVEEIPEPGTGYCYGDGSGTSCPCANDNDGSVAGSGCANGAFTSGAKLTGRGVASVNYDTLRLYATGVDPNNSGLYFQANNDLSPGLVWGDGLQCAGGQLKRLGVRFSDATGASDTSGWATPISVKAGNVMAGDTKRYQLWYRDNSGAQPCGVGVNDFNATNGYVVTWSP